MGRTSRAIPTWAAGGLVCVLTATPSLPADARAQAPDDEAPFAARFDPPVAGVPPVGPDDCCPAAWQPGDSRSGPAAVVAQSICGEVDPDRWRPLPISTLFSEGWNEAWVPSPRGSGGAPRQGWINAASGNLNRAHFFTFAQGFNDAPKDDAYLGSYTLLTPLNRRLQIITNVPFVLHNNVDSGQPVINPSGMGPPGIGPSASAGTTGFGDVSFTPRVLLHETKDVSWTAELAVSTPTGTRPLAGNTTRLTPAVAFWTNVAGGWVVRGGAGVELPTDGSGDEFIGQLAAGQTVTGHDVPVFGDFTYYVSTVVNTPLSGSGRTRVTLTPGVRTHLGNDYYLLAGLPVPVTDARVADLGMIFWLMKAW